MTTLTNVRRMVLCFMLLVSMNGLTTDNEMVLEQIRPLDFKTILPKAGNCYFDAKKNKAIENTAQSNCSPYVSEKGEFRLIAKPYKIILLTFKSKKTNKGQIVFKPQGLAKTEMDEYQVLPDKPVKIKTGASGVVNIEMGGDLIILNRLNSGMEFNIDYEIDYKYSEK